MGGGGVGVRSMRNEERAVIEGGCTLIGQCDRNEQADLIGKGARVDAVNESNQTATNDGLWLGLSRLSTGLTILRQGS
jgi:hypothetical protein